MRKELFHRHALHISYTRTIGARAYWIVEGKHSRLKLGEADPVLLAGVLLRKFKLDAIPLTRYGKDGNSSVRRFKRTVDGIRKTGGYIGLIDKSVDYDIDRVLLIFIKGYLLGKIVHISVNAHSCKAALARIGKNLFVHTLLLAHNRRKDHEALALGKREDAINDLIGGLLTDLLAANRTVRNADARIKQTEVVVDLGDRSP